ncbi:MAG: hypothetical protein IKC11_05120 [Clostridia bacterium]|nr:hypothetical protein [Clostridia bacterium]
MARVFEEIRIYDIDSKSKDGSNKKTKYIEFVYESGKIKDFVKKYIIADYGTYHSYMRDGKFANSFDNYYDFVTALQDVKVDEESGKIKVYHMKPIDYGYVQDKKSPLFVAQAFEGGINGVIELAKELYNKKGWDEETRKGNQTVFTETCKNIIELKEQAEDEPNA